MRNLLMCLMLAGACGTQTAAPAACPTTLNCQPPTNDEDPLCRLPPAQLHERCPSTRIFE